MLGGTDNLSARGGSASSPQWGYGSKKQGFGARQQVSRTGPSD
jgi:hypothetical protein